MSRVETRVLVGSLVLFALTGAAAAETRLTVAINFAQSDATYAATKDIAKAYMKQNPGVTIDVVAYPHYENTMKTKMAANDLPDLWSTHGWSVLRYSEYLTPLNDQPWASLVSPQIKPVITDRGGKIYVLPFDVEMAGVAFNREVLDKAGVDPGAIKTWDDFKAACAKVKKAGKICVHIGGGATDSWTVGNFYDWVAPSFLITNDKQNYRAALKDGSFDWKHWAPVAKLLVDFRDAGYLNPDYTQGSWADVGKKMAAGAVAFGLFGNYVIGEAKKYNPRGKYGFMPVPAATPDDAPTVITGERVTLGVWKDSKHKAEALKFLAFAARPENINKMASINGNPTGLVGPEYKSDLGDLAPYFEKASQVRPFPYFDREYLPNGMWDTMCNTGMGLLAKAMTLDQAVAKMKADYNSLRAK
jgi:raffinose/stachyose/melibiose transport system substrate-binding protein